MSEVHAFDIHGKTWTQKALPSFKKPRVRHVSCILGEKIYIFCGVTHDNIYLRSIEIFDIQQQSDKAKKWELLILDALTKRSDIALCPISDHEILIMGGE